MSHYQKPPELYDGLRLHQNENTGGCSPRVLAALAALRADQVGFYPPYAGATSAIATYLGVPADQITLTNGLDEGIMALAVACLRPSPGSAVPEAIVPEPAFEIFRFDTAVAGGRLVQVMPHADFSFPLTGVLAAITPNTRVVFPFSFQWLTTLERFILSLNAWMVYYSPAEPTFNPYTMVKTPIPCLVK